MATFSSSWTSTAAKEVAGCIGGRRVIAGGCRQSLNREPATVNRNPLIVLDCIILGLDWRKANPSRMILFFYNVALLAALVAGAPWWLWRMATTQKYREGLGQRLGRVPEALRKADFRPAIWLHAVSVGEVLAVSRLVQELGRGSSGSSPADFHHDAHRPGTGSRAVRRRPGLLLSAGSSMGRAERISRLLSRGC